MAGTFTVTGTAGPGVVVTAQVFTNVTSALWDLVGNTLTLFMSTTPSPVCIAITDATTITATKSGSTYTFTIS